MANKTFVRITNDDIYNKLCSIETYLSKLNGKVKWHSWAIGVLFAIILIIIKALI